MSRLKKTLADYVVIAISPALIMTLVGSLVFFLLAVFYQGQHQGRLHWVMLCFVFAAVLISRIAIEEGFERAAPFGAALAIAVALAANKFMEVQGTWIDGFSLVINLTLIAIIWWCSHKLTWDCTVIDEADDASGEGLMQATGLERPADQRDAAADEERKLEGTTSREVPAGYWQRYVQHQRRPHAPGVWVVYFSLAALPLFGVGQWFIPAAHTGARRYVFWLLCVYVSSGLALLVTTSFLGLRRYLRQRRIEMPTLMANLWLTTGAAVILLLLVAAALLPRPSAEYDLAQLGVQLGSPDQDASRFAPSRQDGTQDDQGRAAVRDDEQSTDEELSGSGNQPDSSSENRSDSGNSESSDSSSSESSGASQSSDGQARSQSSDESAQSSQQSQGQQSQGQRSQQQSQSGQQGRSDEQSGQGEQQSESRQESLQQDGASSSQESGQQENRDGESGLARRFREYRETQRELAAEYEDKAEEDPEESSDEDGGSSDSAMSPPSTQEAIEPMLSPVARLIIWARWAIFALGVAIVLWRYREQVWDAVRGMLEGLRALWANLFGRAKRDYGLAEDEVIRVGPARLPFAAFDDPFVSGMANRVAPAELVRYSFDAFEAWAGEHGCPRGPEQTPHELARDVKRLNAAMGPHSRTLAELYARAAYSGAELPASAKEQLRALWQQMRATAGARVVTADELQTLA